MNVKHIVWSTLEDTMALNDDIKLIGKYKVPHFDGKGQLSKYMDKNKDKMNVTHLYTSFYFDNLNGSMKIELKDEMKTFVIPMQDKKLPMVSVQTIGLCANECFNKKI